MFYFTAPGQFLAQQSPARDWGPFVIYVEVADDRRAARRSHPRDAFGYLTALQFSRKPKWRHYFPGAQIITASEFEKVWRDAIASTMRD